MWMVKLFRSLRFALEGLKYTVVTQRNMRIHFLAALGVLMLSLCLPLTKWEILVLFVTITLVLFAELLNTAVEKIVDMVTEDYHPLAKVAKDVTAGAVLLTAGLAIIIGASIFYPYMNTFFTSLIGSPSYPARIGLMAILVFDFFLTMMIKSTLHRMGKEHLEPSMTASIGFCVAAMIIAVTSNLVASLLVYLLVAMLIGTRLRVEPNRVAIIFGSLLGTIVAVIGVQLL